MNPQYDTKVSFTANVRRWVVECFGAPAANDRTERVHRFLEEALELAQAAGCSKTEAGQLLTYVYSRHAGELAQEVGGVMTTLAALCAANGLDSEKCGRDELARSWVNIVRIRTKRTTKPLTYPPHVHTDATGTTYAPCAICADTRRSRAATAP